MQKTLTVGKTYTVTTASECAVTDSNGLVLCTASAGEQKAFVATTSTISFSDDSATVTAVFKGAPALGGSGGSGGGASITFDTAPTADSTNAVTSGGVYTALLHVGNSWSSVNIGTGSASWHSGTCVGYQSYSQWHGASLGRGARGNDYSVAIGAYSSASNYSVAIGCSAKVLSGANYASAYGASAQAADKGVTVIASWNDDGTIQTLLYLMGAGSTLATTYEDGEACMGYVVKDTSGNVSACGTQKLSALMPNNTAWATMALGLDDEPPTPFLPTGATDPIVFPEIEDDLTEE